MEPDFWRRRWADQQIGFHQPTGHPQLPEYWAALDPQPGESVFVPLCGKTRDMTWLAARGHPVTGVEIAERAARDFFIESDVTPDVEYTPIHKLSAAPAHACPVTVEVADLLHDPPGAVGFELFYDRAALIALPEAMRARYVKRLAERLAPNARGILIALDYPPQAMDGPPFCVLEQSVKTLFEPRFTVEALAERDALPDNDRFAARGVTRLTECVYRLTYRPSSIQRGHH